jgi:hypothetical protein
MVRKSRDCGRLRLSIAKFRAYPRQQVIIDPEGEFAGKPGVSTRFEAAKLTNPVFGLNCPPVA